MLVTVIVPAPSSQEVRNACMHSSVLLQRFAGLHECIPNAVLQVILAYPKETAFCYQMDSEMPGQVDRTSSDQFSEI